PPLGICVGRNAQRARNVCGVAVSGLYQMMIETRGEKEHLLACGRVDDGARIGGDSGAPAQYAQITGFQMREERVVAFDRHHGFVRRGAVAVAQRPHGKRVPSVFPGSAAQPPARAQPQDRDGLVDTAHHRVAALKDLHPYDRPSSVALQDVARAIEIRIRIVAVAHLLDGQIEDFGRESRLHLPRAFAGRTGGSPFRHERGRAVCYSSGVTNTEIAGILMRMRTLMELSGESFYKFMAYERAAAALENAAPVNDLIAAGELKSLPGIGKTLSAIIEEIVRTGTCQPYETLQQRYPASIFEILGVSGIGIKTAAMLFDQYGIGSLAQLEAAIDGGALAEAPHMGPKTIDNIRRGILAYRGRQRRTPLARALALAREIVEYLQAGPPVHRLQYAGSLRRAEVTVGDVDVVCTSDRPAEVIERFTRWDRARAVLAEGPTKAGIWLEDGLQID